MAETLVELVAKIKADSSELEKGLTDAEKQTEASSKKMSESLKKVGMAMAASGAAITAALGLMGKAAIDEDINIKRLAGTLGTVGISYDKVKDSLEGVIAETQRKTGIADNEQRDMLSRLILITQDYDAALKLMPIALDLAADAQMDTTTAATYLSKAYLDLEDGAEKVSVRFGMASVEFKNMEDIQARVAGKAEALANPLSVLKASIGDVAEEIGKNLIPLIKDATSKIVDIAIKVQEWTKEHPELAKVLTLVALGIGAVLTVVGGLILSMPTIISLVTAFGVVLHAALGPVGLIIIGITALIAAGILLWQNWDTVSRSIAGAMAWLVEKIMIGVNKIVEGFAWLMYKIADFVSLFSNEWANSIRNAADSMTESVRSFGEKSVKSLTDFSNSAIEAKETIEETEKATTKAGEAANKASVEVDKLGKSYEKASKIMEVFNNIQELVLHNLQSVLGFGGVSPGVLAGQRYQYATEQEWAEALAGMGNIYTGTGWITPEHTPEQYKEALETYGTPEESVKGYQHGGLVKNTGLAYLHQGETIIPANDRIGGVTVNFTQPVFFDREDTMNRFVDMISKGIDRKQRLRFGGAYSG